MSFVLKIPRRRAPSWAAPIFLVLFSGGCSAQQPATVTVDPSATFQTIDAWEATARMWEFDKTENRFNGSWEPIAEPILTKLIDEGGINRLRLEIRSGAENPVDYWSKFRTGHLSYGQFKDKFYEKINDNDDPDSLNPAGIQFSELDYRVETLIQPAIRIAKRLGRPMRVTLCYVDFKWTTDKGTLSHARNPEEYAELIAATYAHLRQKYDLAPDKLEIILEPDNSDHWRGQQIGQAIVAATRRLEKDGFSAPRIIAPSTSLARNTPAYFDGMAKVPGATTHLSELSYHRYDRLVSEGLLREIRERARKVGAQPAMLEWTNGTIDDLFDDLTIANASGWQKYAIATLAQGGPVRPGYMLFVTKPDPASPRMALLPQARVLAQVFRFVDPGAVRIGALSDADWARAVAFRNPDDAMTVVVKANNGMIGQSIEKLNAKLDISLPAPSSTGGEWVKVAGLKPGAYLMQRTNAKTGGRIRCRMDVKAGGIPTLFMRGGDVATLAGQSAATSISEAACPADSGGWR